MSLESQLDRLVTARDNIRTALGDKGINASNHGFEDFAQDIGNISGGSSGGGATQKNINFIDYDGTIVHSYTTAEFATLTTMPENPSHAGLTAQGWNWTLAKAQAYAAKYGNLWIGQMYVTDDGKTRVYISLEEGRLEPYLGIAVNGTAVIEWGDGTTDTISGTSTTSVIDTQHVYPAPGKYVITIDVTGSLRIVGNNSYDSRLLCKNVANSNLNRVYQNAVQKVEIGRNASIGDSAFRGCFSLMSVTIPDSVTSIEGSVFQNCYSLTSITIPDSVTSIGNSVFQNCYSLTSITIPDSVTSIRTNTFNCCYSLTSVIIPDSVTSIGSSAFSSCFSLMSVTIPDSVTIIGSSTFQNCYSLTSVTIPDGVTSIEGSVFSSCYGLTSIIIPDSVTNIGVSAFYNCYSLTSVTIPNSVTSILNNAFYNCYSLTSITIPDSVTSIESNVFNGCYGLTSVIIPDGVTSIRTNIFQNCFSLMSVTIPDSVTSIGNSVFQNCYSLTSITIPDSVTSIGGSVFNGCYGLGLIRFVAATPPTASSSNTWSSIPTDCIIYVPSGTLAAYTSATNYPSSSTYSYIEY